MPTIKELYSLIDFRGLDLNPEGTRGATPFIDTNYFGFEYGDTSAGERIIDVQWISSTEYVGGGLVFGVNFADGRIKGYGLTLPGRGEKTFFVRYVRGNTSYGVNDFIDNGEGTVGDLATGLMWSQDDSGYGMDWEEALGYMNGRWFDVHGAGAQRSDPKSGNASQFPRGKGPQGDAIRIDNFVRVVRDIGQ